MEEPLFAEVKEEVKKEEPSDDYLQETVRIGMKRPRPGNGPVSAWEKAAGAQNAADIMRQIDAEEKPPVKEEIVEEDDRKPPLSEIPSGGRCPDCGMCFLYPCDFKKHREFFKGQPHFYCLPCNAAGNLSDFQEHQTSNQHLFSITNAKEPRQSQAVASVRKATKRPFIGEAERTPRRALPSKMVFPLWEEAAGAQNAEDIVRKEEGPILKMELQEETGLKAFVGDLPFSFTCPMCAAGFHVFQALQQHVNSLHHGGKPFWCHVCPARFKSVVYYWSHMKVHGLTEPQDHPAGYECDECGTHFRRRSHYAFHCQHFRGRDHLYCQPCDQAVFTDQWVRHGVGKKHRLARRASRNRLISEEQGLVTRRCQELRQIERSGESTEIERSPPFWKCPVETCGAFFLSPTTGRLLQHMALHPGVRLPFPWSPGV